VTPRTKLDWIRAGQELLRGGGIRAVKVRDLARALGATTGSFYHHFDNVETYLDALAEQYAADSEALERQLAGTEPVALIRTLLGTRTAADIPALDRAMRVWAADDDRARAAVERLDRILMTLVESAFRDLGFPRAEARMRARTAFAAGVGLGLTAAPWPVGPSEEKRALALFLSPGA
jgi:AcrR family transcriptional regulator